MRSNYVSKRGVPEADIVAEAYTSRLHWQTSLCIAGLAAVSASEYRRDKALLALIINNNKFYFRRSTGTWSKCNTVIVKSKLY